MKMKRLRFSSALCTILVVLFGVGVRRTYSHEVLRYYKEGDVIIGALLNMHLKGDDFAKCGEFHPTGVGFAEVLSFTIDRINNDSSLLPNVTIGYDIRDYCDNPMLAVKWSHDFVVNVSTNRIVAVIGPEDSNTAMMVAGMLQLHNIPLVSFAASSEELSSPMYRTFFRTIPPDHNQAKSIVDIIEHFNWTYVAAAAVDHSYGRYGMRALETEADVRQTFCLAFTAYFTRTGYKNKIQDIVSRLKRHPNIKVIVLWSTEEPARRFLDEAMRQNLHGRTFLISESLATNEGQFFEKYSNVIDGCLGTVPYYKPYPEFDDHIKNVTPESTLTNVSNKWWEEMWTSEFNCSILSRKCEKYKTSKMSEKSLDKMYNAFSAKLIDAVLAVAHALDMAYRCTKNGTDPLNACVHFNETITPRDVTKNLHRVSTDGFSGKIQFDENGNPQASSYKIINAQLVASSSENGNTYTKTEVGLWNQLSSPRLAIYKGAITWQSNHRRITDVPKSVCNNNCPPGKMQTATKACCWQCIDCPFDSISKIVSSPNCTKCTPRQRPNSERTACVDLPIENLEWNSLVSLAMFTLSIVGLAITVSTFVVYLRFWDTPIVKASCRELTCVLFVSISSCFVLAILYLHRPTKILCMALAPLRYISYSICISVLFLKTVRILQAFQVNPMRKKHCGKTIFQGKHTYSITAVVLVNIVQVSLAIVWLLTDPPTCHEEIRPLKSIFIICKPYQYLSGNALQITMILYLVLLAGLSTLYAFKARQIPENFNEARCIVFSQYILILSWIVFYPVHFALDGWYVAVVSNASTLLSSYGLLLCIFSPKLYVIFWHPERNTLQYIRAEVARHTMRKASMSFSSRHTEANPTDASVKPPGASFSSAGKGTDGQPGQVTRQDSSSPSVRIDFNNKNVQ